MQLVMMGGKFSNLKSIDSAATRRVLVVEDESISRRALTRLLTAVGFQVVSASSAEEAIEKLKIDKPDSQFELALVDLDLPGMSGADFIQWAHDRFPQTQAMLMTGAAEHRLRAALARCSVPCLRKPLDFQSVVSYIASVGVSSSPNSIHRIGF